MELSNRKTRYFVTGGAGFIGSHLVDKLINEGQFVTVYDNLISGTKENIKDHFGDANFQFIEADLLDLEKLTDSIKGHDVVWHFGANTDIPGGNKDTTLDLNYCTTATYNVIEAMRRTNIKPILFASSSTVYGDTPLIPIKEDYGPNLPISLYGAGKLAGEGLISSYCHLFDLNAYIFRFGNVLGSRMGHGIIYDFIMKLRNNPKELEILGDGNQEKNYFLVEDCLSGMTWAFKHSKEQCDVFNLGSDSTVKVSEIARIVTEELGLNDVEFKYTGGRRGWPGDAPYVMYDTSKMKALGWSAPNSSADAVRIATRRLISTL